MTRGRASISSTGKLIEFILVNYCAGRKNERSAWPVGFFASTLLTVHADGARFAGINNALFT